MIHYTEVTGTAKLYAGLAFDKDFYPSIFSLLLTYNSVPDGK